MFCVGVYDLISDTGYLSTRDVCNISPIDSVYLCPWSLPTLAKLRGWHVTYVFELFSSFYITIVFVEGYCFRVVSKAKCVVPSRRRVLVLLFKHAQHANEFRNIICFASYVSRVLSCLCERSTRTRTKSFLRPP